jgi:hypothetical protein
MIFDLFLYHHITLFSLYEFCLVKVFSSKVFNEVISTKLYASSLTFPYRGFYAWWLQAYFSFRVQYEFYSWSKSIVYSLFFPQGCWGDNILEDNLQMIKWTWIDQGRVLQYVCSIPSIGCDSFSPSDTPFGEALVRLYINTVFPAMNNNSDCLCHSLRLVTAEI